ncbi:MAG: lysine 2,3-aminomutase [Bacteroidales bacterium]|nr:lysine 2,3-aminomutase [Bacteroidales bacterium]
MKKYKQININNYKQNKHILKLPKEIIEDIEIVGQVLAFRANNYITEELINWDSYETDPIFHLCFPQREMLKPEHYQVVKNAIYNKKSKEELFEISNLVRKELNPHPAGQSCLNVPYYKNRPLSGIQHKYRETVLFFPSSGQTCHAYCSFCFRWPQFIGKKSLKFSAKESHELVKYLKVHPEVTDVLLTGGDPMIMKMKVLNRYLSPLLENIHKTNIQTIRIGTKSLSFWPYRFVSDSDADDILRLFESIVNKGINLAIMAHFSHPRELETDIVKEAIRRIRSTGAQIRTQSPILKHINDDADIWSEMWRKQVNLNCIPYYMFMARDTGAKEYFEIPIAEAYEIFRKAYSSISGICRTVRGPSMSCTPGKVMISGLAELNNEKVFVLRFIQARNPDWVAMPFFAKYDDNASWISELKPAFSDKFFFEDEMEQIYHNRITDCEENKFE